MMLYKKIYGTETIVFVDFETNEKGYCKTKILGFTESLKLAVIKFI